MQEDWRSIGSGLVVGDSRRAGLNPVEVPFTPPRIRRGALSNPLLPVVGFILLILAGTMLLLLPVSSSSAGPADPRDALFTATSAVTVTGLVVVDTDTHWTFFGHVVIMCLMFLGGLGIMTGATLFYLLFFRHHPITLADSVQVSRSLGRFHPGDVVKLIKSIVVVAILIQLVGFLFIFGRLVIMDNGMPLIEVAWQTGFHVVSAFNNAGFTISSGDPFLSLGDRTTLGVMSILILLGTISYFVLADLVRHRRRLSQLSLNTKMVLVGSGGLLLIGMLTFLIGEYTNPATIGHFSLADKLTTAFFHSISGRTAGFSLIDFSQVGEQNILWSIVMMFIGGATGSAAGGIKVTTAGILMAAALASLSNRRRVIAFRKELPLRTVSLALTVALLSVIFIAFSVILQTIWGRSGTEDAITQLPFLHLLFETVSAFGTNGLTMGVSSELSRWGQCFLIVTMFVGRLGPLTLALIMVRKEAKELYHYPEEEVTIG